MSERHQSKAARADDCFFTRKMFHRQYLPALLSALTLTASDVADAVVVGNSIGLVGLAAMAFALPVFMVYNVIMHSFGLGGSIRYAGQMARAEEDKARAGFQGVMTTVVLIGLGIAALGNVLLRPLAVLLGADPANEALFEATATYVRLLLMSAPPFFISYSLAYYMRNADLEKEASLSASVGNISDVALNIVLVLVLRMGVLGAGIATMAGVLITSALELIFLRVRKSSLRLLPLKPDFNGVIRAFRTGFSSCASYIYSLVHILLCNNILMRMAGERGVAVFDIIQNISYFYAYLYGAVSQASQPILSTYQSEHNAEGCRFLQRLGLRAALLVGLAAAVVMAIIAPLICHLFGLTDAEAVNLGSWAIRMFCIGTMLGGTSALLAGFRLARGQELPAFLSTTLRGAAVLLPVTVLFSFFGERWFWLLYPVTELIALGIFLIFLRRRGQPPDTIAPERVYRTLLHDSTAEIAPMTSAMEAFCERWEASMKQQYFVQMTAEEMCSAIIVNGFNECQDRSGMIQITLVAGEDGIFTLHVRDSAVAFNPFGMAATDVREDGEHADFNAVGMDVIKRKAREFYYRRYQGFNTMVVKI